MTDREKALTDSVKLEFESTQRETFAQRQQLLQQSEEMRRREAETREEKTHMERSVFPVIILSTDLPHHSVNFHKISSMIFRWWLFSFLEKKFPFCF